MKKINSFGFSLVQVLVAIGLVGGLSAVVAELMSNISKNNKSAEQKSNQIELIAYIQNILSNSDRCSYNFGSSAPGGSLTVGAPASVLNINQIIERNAANPAAPLVRVQVYDGTPASLYNSQIRVTRIEIRDFNPTLTGAGAFTQRATARLQISTAKDIKSTGSDLYQNRTIPMEIEFAAVYNPAGINTIVSCTSSGVLSDTIWIKKVNNDIYYPGGRVGIGTINPSELLSIESAANNVNIASFKNPGGWGQIFVETGNSMSVLASVDGQGTIVGSNSNHPLRLRSNSVDQVTLLPNGDLGVGTVLPQTKLDVSGYLRFGNSGVACSATNLGALRRDGTNAISYCVQTAPGVFNWIPFATTLGPVTCPAGMILVGPVGERSTFCMDNNSRAPQSLGAAFNTCSGVSLPPFGTAHVCTASEWVKACRMGVGAGMMGGAEYVSNPNMWNRGDQSWATVGLGGAHGCEAVGASWPNNFLRFRCCL